MAGKPRENAQPEEELVDRESERQRLKEEKKRLKAEQKAQKKEAKQKAREISDQEEELDGEPGGLPVFLVTALIVAVWIAILCVLVKLDVGGVGTNVLKPLLKDVPVVNKILPNEQKREEEEDEYSAYGSVEDAVAQIRQLEQELQMAQEQNLAYANEEEYQKYYESMDPATAEYLYQQTLQETSSSKEIEDYVAAYSSMKAKDAAAIFDTMTSDLDLVAKILGAMSADDRAKILEQMNEENAARLTKMMDPG